MALIAEPHAQFSVSVIVPTRDRPELLREALASVRALEGPDLCAEIIVADNGSSPATIQVAGAFAARYIRVPNGGAAAARNAGINAAQSPFLAFLDDDDVWSEGHLRPQIELLRARPELCAAVGRTQMVDMALRPLGDPWPAALPDDGHAFLPFLRQYPQIGATVIRREAIASIGLLDEALVGDEDWDWHLRLALACRIGFVPVTSVLFRQRPAGRDDDVQWRRFADFRRVFRRNLRRAGSRRPGIWVVARTYVAHCGEYYWYFLQSARAHVDSGERKAARKCLRRAFRASPLHFLRDLALPRGAHGAIIGSLPRPAALPARRSRPTEP